MKNMEAKINGIDKMNQGTQDSEIYGECQLRLIEFYNKTFGELETDKRKKEEKIDKVEEKAKKKKKKNRTKELMI